MSTVDISALVEGLPKLVPAAKAGELLAVSTRTLRRWVNVGKIRALKTAPGGSGRVLIPRDEIKRILGQMVQVPQFDASDG